MERQRIKVDGACRKPVGEKRVNDRQAILDRNRTQAPIIAQKALIPAGDPRGRRKVAAPICLDGSDTMTGAQPVEKLASGGRRARQLRTRLSQPGINLRPVRKIQFPFLKPETEPAHLT